LYTHNAFGIPPGKKSSRKLRCKIPHPVSVTVGNKEVYLPWAPKTYIFEVFMVNHLVFMWPKPLFFMVLGAHGRFASNRCLEKKYTSPNAGETHGEIHPMGTKNP